MSFATNQDEGKCLECHKDLPIKGRLNSCYTECYSCKKTKVVGGDRYYVSKMKKISDEK